MGQIATTISQLGGASLGYADRILTDVKPGDFGRMPPGIKTNTPAFVFGHLATYPDRVLEMIGRADLAAPDARYTELFAAGKECLDDPDGSRYPSMEEIVARFKSRHEALLRSLPEVADDVFARPTPNERMKERFPTIGVLTSFLLGSHIMLHMGQLSAWRRCMGLGPCM